MSYLIVKELPSAAPHSAIQPKNIGRALPRCVAQDQLSGPGLYCTKKPKRIGRTALYSPAKKG